MKTGWWAIVRIACFQDFVCFVWLTMKNWTIGHRWRYYQGKIELLRKMGKKNEMSNCKLHQGRKAISALVYLNAFPMTAVPMLAMIWKTGWRLSPYELLRWWTSCRASPEHLGDQLEESVYIWREREDFFVWDGFCKRTIKSSMHFMPCMWSCSATTQLRDKVNVHWISFFSHAMLFPFLGDRNGDYWLLT